MNAIFYIGGHEWQRIAVKSDDRSEQEFLIYFGFTPAAFSTNPKIKKLIFSLRGKFDGVLKYDLTDIEEVE